MAASRRNLPMGYPFKDEISACVLYSLSYSNNAKYFDKLA